MLTLVNKTLIPSFRLHIVCNYLSVIVLLSICSYTLLLYCSCRLGCYNHYITLHYVTLRYVTLRYVTLRYVTLHYTSLK